MPGADAKKGLNEVKSMYVPPGTGLVQGKTSGVLVLKLLQKSVPATVTQNVLSTIVKPHPTGGPPGSPVMAPFTGFNVRTVVALATEDTASANSTPCKNLFMLLRLTVTQSYLKPLPLSSR